MKSVIMEVFKKQPKELPKHELHQTCSRCNAKMDLTEKKSTIFRDKWYHVWCWKSLKGI